jgi:WD40 repeat protein
MNNKRTIRSRSILLCFVIAGSFVAPVPTLGAAAEKLSELRGVFRANFNHNGSRVVVRHRDGDVGIWEVPAGPRIAGDLAPNTGANSYVMSPDGKSVLVGLKDGQARVFDATTAKAISPVLDGSLTSETQMPGLFSPDGNTVLIFSAKEAAVFNVREGKRVAALPLASGSNEDEPGSAAFAADGAQCFVIDGSGTVTRYDSKSWKPIGQPMKHPAAESAYDFGFNVSDDGKWLVTFDGPGENGPKGHLQVWDMAANKPVGKPVAAVNGLTGKFVGNNRLLIEPGRGEANVRDLPSLKVAYSLRPHDDVDGPSVDISPDKKWVLSWGPDRLVNLYDATSGKLASPKSAAATVSQVMMAPDSASCYVLFENSAFLLQNHYDYYLIKMTFPELEITNSARILESVSSVSSLSLDGKRLLVIQGPQDQERLVFFDTAKLEPLQ